MGIEYNPPIDPRYAQQSPFTNGDRDTGMPVPEHGEPVILTSDERDLGITAIARIRQQMSKGSTEVSSVDAYPQAVGDYEFGDKVRILREGSNGFTPHTKEEATIAFQVMGNGKLDTARYLNEILQKQRNNGYSIETGHAAIRAATRQIIAYHEDARILRGALSQNYQILQDISNPNLRLSQLTDDEAIDMLGLLAILRDAEVAKAAKLPTNGRRQLRKLADGGLSQVSLAEPSLMGIELELAGIDDTVGNLRDSTLQSGLSQRHRRDMWLHAVEDARRHAAARTVVEDYLGKIAA